MRKYTKTVGALAAASALVAGYASAGDLEGFTGEVHVGYHSIYDFRFVDLGSDLVEAGVDVAYALNEDWSFKAGAWYGSVNDSQTIGGNFNELDLYAAAATSLGPVNLELGYIYYYYPDAIGADTQEVYLSGFVDIVWGISAGATYFYDFDSNNGWYLQPEIRKSFEFNECLALNLSAGVGVADGLNYQVDANPLSNGSHDGFQGWFIKAELPWEFRDGVTLAPYVKYTDADSDLAGDINSLEGGQEHIIAGVKIAVGF
ncbi:hypothetical protein OKA05_17445 [Luteolibacter arcticus]|uniref:Porin n=1 Tax=Luteolibacter arcticus TaxID=1581411 RepID=A0ABT3GLF9_9BACT|nr:TorF family putative porin [Luteolibacter arcticus]MCW1924355.1 hypothetical protein [Luteolibacter arcticus]